MWRPRIKRSNFFAALVERIEAQRCHYLRCQRGYPKYRSQLNLSWIIDDKNSIMLWTLSAREIFKIHENSAQSIPLLHIYGCRMFFRNWIHVNAKGKRMSLLSGWPNVHPLKAYELIIGTVLRSIRPYPILQCSSGRIFMICFVCSFIICDSLLTVYPAPVAIETRHAFSWRCPNLTCEASIPFRFDKHFICSFACLVSRSFSAVAHMKLWIIWRGCICYRGKLSASPAVNMKSQTNTTCFVLVIEVLAPSCPIEYFMIADGCLYVVLVWHGVWVFAQSCFCLWRLYMVISTRPCDADRIEGVVKIIVPSHRKLYCREELTKYC